MLIVIVLEEWRGEGGKRVPFRGWCRYRVGV